LFTPFEMSNMESLIKAGKNLDISHEKIHFKAFFIDKENHKIIINYTSLIDKYYDFLKKIIVDYEMTDEEFIKYKFQPKRFCMDMYGTTELWSTLLRINNMVSAIQFTNKKIKAFTQDIFDVLNEILILEDDRLKSNRIEVYG
jgi:hypothetical protein